jgi:hypothetical protein
LKGYPTPDGVTMSGTFTGPPESDRVSGFEWSGEWVVTYETFRDLGLAFAAALVLIYFLLVVEFRNFLIPMTVMLPIPLTIIGIVPGHWLLDAEFTATSMIGFIALAGICLPISPRTRFTREWISGKQWFRRGKSACVQSL